MTIHAYRDLVFIIIIIIIIIIRSLLMRALVCVYVFGLEQFF